MSAIGSACLVRLASGDVVSRQGDDPVPPCVGKLLMQWTLGDGDRIESRSPWGSQFSLASVTCASDAEVAAALACRPGFARAISSSCTSVNFFAHADDGAATVTATADRRSRQRR
jgi:hypothetical protein